MHHFIRFIKNNKWYPVALLIPCIIASYLYVLNLPWKPYWLDGKEFWYQLFFKGEKVGFVQLNYNFQKNGIFQISQLTRINTMNRGQNFGFSEKEVLNFDTSMSGELVSASYYRQQSDYIEHTELNLTDGYLQGEKQTDNHKVKVRLKQDNYKLAEHLQLMQWPEQNPSTGDTLSSRIFDLGELAINPVTYRVLEENDLTDSFIIGFQVYNRSWQGIIELSSTGHPVSFSVSRLVEQRLASKEEALKSFTKTDYYLSQVISIDKPLGDIDSLTSLTVTLSKTIQHGIITDQRQYFDKNGALNVTRLNNHKTVNEDDYSKFLNENLTNHNTPSQANKELSEFAQTIVGNSHGIEEKVSKLVDFVAKYLVDVPVIRPMTIATILQQRKGDCTEHTRLFIALARALSIPAREVHGLVYLGDEIQGFGGHVWSEVIINDKWVAVDPTWNLQSLSATHIQLENEDNKNIFNQMHNDSKLSFRLMKAHYQ